MRCLRVGNRMRKRERENEIEKMNKRREGGGMIGLGTRDDSGSRGVAAVGGTEG